MSERTKPSRSFFDRSNGLFANAASGFGAFFLGPQLSEQLAPVMGDYAADHYANWLRGPAEFLGFLACLVLVFAGLRMASAVSIKALIVWWRVKFG